MSSKQRMMFDNLKKNYSELHKELVRFTEDLPTKLQKNVPSELQNVRVLPTYMSPTDSDFTVNDVITVLEKWQFISDTLDSVLQKISFYVVDKGWYRDQQMKLEWWLQLVKNSSSFLKAETPDYGRVVEVTSGIGGVNWYNTDITKKLDMKSKEQSIRSLSSALNTTYGTTPLDMAAYLTKRSAEVY